jgi:formylglycine-generating enzyme required for sulfatase activity
MSENINGPFRLIQANEEETMQLKNFSRSCLTIATTLITAIIMACVFPICVQAAMDFIPASFFGLFDRNVPECSSKESKNLIIKGFSSYANGNNGNSNFEIRNMMPEKSEHTEERTCTADVYLYDNDSLSRIQKIQYTLSVTDGDLYFRMIMVPSDKETVRTPAVAKPTDKTSAPQQSSPKKEPAPKAALAKKVPSRPKPAPAKKEEPSVPKPVALPKTYTNSIGMAFVLIPSGSFMMGSDKAKDSDAENNEMPQHRVTISKPFYMGKYEVTQEQWEAVMGRNRSGYGSDNNPVENVSWDEVQEFIRELNQKEGINRYRLPTEAEWEYAARAGSETRYSFGDDRVQLGRYAWYSYSFGSGTRPVGQRQPNAWGLYDVHGNVLEWVSDWYDADYYLKSSSIDPYGPSSGSYRVIRGGSWFSKAGYCRSAYRGIYSPDYRDYYLGFRLALSPEHQ